MEIVKSSDGKYSVRRKSRGGYEYLDLTATNSKCPNDKFYYWGIDSKYINDCKTASLERLMNFLMDNNFKIFVEE